jgi:hypothetical protein
MIGRCGNEIAKSDPRSIRFDRMIEKKADDALLRKDAWNRGPARKASRRCEDAGRAEPRGATLLQYDRFSAKEEDYYTCALA